MTGALVKICGMRDGLNVTEVCAEGPDFLGFVFVSGSPRCAAGLVSRDTMAGVPQHIKKIGVFRDEELPVVLDCIAELGLDGVQLHGGEDASYALNIKKHSPGAFILKAVEVATGSNIHSLTTMHGIDMFLLDSGAGGTGVSFDWSLLQNYRSSVPFLLAGGLSEKHIEAALELMATVPQCRGIDVNSKVEISPGVKNIELVRQIIRRVRGV